MPSDLRAALQALLGHCCTIVTGAGNFTGTVANVTDHLVTLCANGGVVYIRPSEITACSTANPPA